MLSGDRVVLREVGEADLPTIYGIFRDLDSWELRGPVRPGPLTWQSFSDWYGNRLSGDDVEFAIVAGDAVVGRCCLMREDALARHAAIGIALAAAARGQGHGTDAVRVLADFAFVRRNLRRLHLQVVADNLPAIRSYRKAGFVEEGRAREHAYVRGRYVDVMTMGLLRSDWAGPPRVDSLGPC